MFAVLDDGPSNRRCDDVAGTFQKEFQLEIIFDLRSLTTPGFRSSDCKTGRTFSASLSLAADRSFAVSDRGFGSDNHSGIHPVIFESLKAANTGHAPSYGTDDWSERAQKLF